MSTHCHPPSPGVLYGTLGVPIGIIVIGPFLLPLPCALYKQEKMKIAGNHNQYALTGGNSNKSLDFACGDNIDKEEPADTFNSSEAL
jgi:hypothetical protein